MNSLRLKTIISPLLGIISIGLYWFRPLEGGFTLLIYITMGLLCAIIGLILGIKELKTPSKSLAIIGIIVCTISLLWGICGLILWWAMGEWQYL